MCVPLSAGDLGVYVYPRLFVTQYKCLTIARDLQANMCPCSLPTPFFIMYSYLNCDSLSINTWMKWPTRGFKIFLWGVFRHKPIQVNGCTCVFRHNFTVSALLFSPCWDFSYCSITSPTLQMSFAQNHTLLWFVSPSSMSDLNHFFLHYDLKYKSIAKEVYVSICICSL